MKIKKISNNTPISPVSDQYFSSYRRIAQLEAAGAAFKSGADNIESAYMGQGYSSSKKFRV